MYRYFVFVLAIASIGLLGGCRWKNTKQALKHGEVLKSSIESFEKR